MTEQEEITEYQKCLEEALAKLCTAMGVEPETYDKDQSDFQNYINCANDAAALIEKLKAMAASGFELASYASYSEIVGCITHNRSAIRTECDSVFQQRADINEKLDGFFQ